MGPKTFNFSINFKLMIDKNIKINKRSIVLKKLIEIFLRKNKVI